MTHIPSDVSKLHDSSSFKNLLGACTLLEEGSEDSDILNLRLATIFGKLQIGLI